MIGRLRRPSFVFSAVLLLAAIFLRAGLTLPRDYPESYPSSGQFLIRGFAAPDAHHLPMADAIGAFLVHWELSVRWYAAVCAVLMAILVLAVEGLLESGVGAWTAAAAVALIPWVYPQSALALIVLMIAGLMIWRSRDPSPFRTAVLAVSIGTSLLFRSTLALLPPAIVALDAVSRATKPRRWRALNPVILLIVPYFVLLPWILSNWRTYHRFIPFEDGEATCNIVTGARGVVETVEGPWWTMMGDVSQEQAVGMPLRAVLTWAAGEIIAHPLRYGRAVAVRMGRVISWSFPYVLLSLWAIWRHRRKEEVRQLALLAAYFVVIHCLMSIEKNYFLPLFPILLILAGGAVARTPLGGVMLSPRASRRVLLGSLSAMVLLSFYTVTTLDGAAMTPQSLDQFIAAHPRDFWSRVQRGARRLSEEDFPGAGSDLAVATGLRPDDFEANVLQAEAALFQGDPSAALKSLPFAPKPKPVDRLEARLIRADAMFHTSGRSAALDEMRAGREGWMKDFLVRGASDSQSENALAVFLREGEDDFMLKLDYCLRRWPGSERLVIASLIVDVAPRSPWAWMLQSNAQNRMGATSEAEKSMARAGALARSDYERIRVAEKCLELGMPRFAASLLEPLEQNADALIVLARAYSRLGQPALARAALGRAETKAVGADRSWRIRTAYRSLEQGKNIDEPAQLELMTQTPDILLQRARILSQRGQADAALEMLARAGAMGGSPADRLGIAGAYTNLGEASKALGILEALPPESAVMLEKARAFSALGRAAEASRQVDEALKNKLTAQLKYKAVLIRQDLKQYPGALSLLRGLLNKEPDNIEWLNARAICEYSNGAPEIAIETLKKSLSLSPRFLPTYATLGAIYTDQKRFVPALELYRRALSMAGTEEGSPLYRTIAKDYQVMKKTVDR